jgi:hypothetical protein
MGDVRDATEAAIKAATHLTDMDRGAIEALRSLADKIDAWDVIVDWANDDAATVEGKRPAVPANDNVSIPTYLRFCESLGLTPTGRTRAQIEKGKGEGGGSTLGRLRSVHGKAG